MVATENFAGVERYVAYVAPLLANAGWDVTVIGGNPDAMTRALGDSVRHIPARSAVDVAIQVVKLGRGHRVIHAHMTAAEFGILVARPLGATLVSTRHFAAHRGSTIAAKVAGRLTTQLLAAQVSISQFVADAIHEPSLLIPNGVPDAATHSMRPHRVLVAQRMEAEKDSRVALQAWAACGLANQGWSLAFAGRGSEELQLRALARELGVTDSVTFLGFVEDLAHEMERSAIFLATALAEPFGLSVVEAMACGLPVVASGSGAHRETVGAVAPELLFAPGDVSACAALLHMVAAEIDQCAWGDRLRAYQQERFSLNGHVSQLVALYDRLLVG